MWNLPVLHWSGQPNLCIDGFFAMSANPQFRRGDTVVGAMTGCGTFAEETIVPGIAGLKIDDDIPLDVAALVGWGDHRRGSGAQHGRDHPGSSVLVIGAGGVGVAAIQGARIAGARIVAVDLHEGKLDRAKAFGATHGVLPDDLPAALAEITAGKGFRLHPGVHRHADHYAAGLRHDPSRGYQLHRWRGPNG
ncbi:MAG: hypothetical protein Ct9H300mP31_20710 [Acidimicrobiaceae bacterium]|nr:MAG: hypothetical protein Ct9H300mP31_20710 [Acidimicrobiaceae bacterium]